MITLCCATLCAAACGATSPTDAKPPLPTASATPSAPVATDASAALPDASADLPYAPPPSPAVITVTTVKVPTAIVLDGDPTEWGPLDVIPPARVDGTRQGSGLSRVALALDEKAIHLVGAIGGDARSGLTVALRFGSSEVPDIGYAQRGGGLRGIGDCSEEVKGQTPPADECRAIYAAHDKFRAAHVARFTRVFHVSDSGITADDAALSKLVAAGTWTRSVGARHADDLGRPGDAHAERHGLPARPGELSEGRHASGRAHVAARQEDGAVRDVAVRPFTRSASRAPARNRGGA